MIDESQLKMPISLHSCNGIFCKWLSQKPNFEITIVRVEESCHEVSHNERGVHILGIMDSITLKCSSRTGSSGWLRWDTAQPGVLGQETESSSHGPKGNNLQYRVSTWLQVTSPLWKFLIFVFFHLFSLEILHGSRILLLRVCMVTWTTESLGL